MDDVLLSVPDFEANIAIRKCITNSSLFKRSSQRLHLELVYRFLITSDVEPTWTGILWDKARNFQLLCIQTSDASTCRGGG